MSLSVGINSFVSLSDAGTYFADRLYATTWTGSTDADREKALRMASAALSRESYRGSLSNSAQLLAWPRAGAVDAEGRVIDQTVIPAVVRDATCELALAYLGEDLTQNDGNRGVRAVKAGSVEVTYNGEAPRRRLPDFVQALIAPLLAPAGTSSFSVALVF